MNLAVKHGISFKYMVLEFKFMVLVLMCKLWKICAYTGTLATQVFLAGRTDFCLVPGWLLKSHPEIKQCLCVTMMCAHHDIAWPYLDLS